MSNREYIWKRDDGFSKSTGLVKHMAVAATRVVTGHGPFDLSQDGDPIASNLSRVDVLSRYRTAVSHRELGSVFRIRKDNGKVVFAGRAVKEQPDRVIDINGNDHADEFWTWIVVTYPQYHPRFAGSYVCKNVAGSTTKSQHSYGNADDVFFDSAAHQEVVFWDIVHGKCPVPVAHTISLRHIWSPSGGVQPYSGDTHYHGHTDFLPQYSGSCGVRG